VSELEESALSVSDAARILSNSRYNKDEETPEPQVTPSAETGVRGLERGLGYEPMRPAMPVKEAEADALENAQEAADVLKARRDQQVRAVNEVQYLHLGGEDSGKPMPANETVSAEQAAFDLSNYRRGITDHIEAIENHQIAQAIDELRNPQPVEQQPQITQPEAQQQAPADDEVARALQNPKVLAAIQDYVGHANQQAAAVAQQYVAATQQNASAAAAALLHSYPELQGLTDPQQLRTAIQVTAKQNPQRAQAMVNHVEAVRRVVGEWQQAAGAQQAAYQQAAQQQFNAWGKACDDAFDAWAGEQVSGAELEAIRDEACEMMKEEYGATAEQLGQAWHSNPTMRSLQGQKMIFEAARNRLHRKSIASKLVKGNIPTVQRPGSGNLERPTANEAELSALGKRLDKLGTVKAAADLLIARRGRR
jgi:hypothetical protein